MGNPRTEPVSARNTLEVTLETKTGEKTCAVVKASSV